MISDLTSIKTSYDCLYKYNNSYNKTIVLLFFLITNLKKYRNFKKSEIKNCNRYKELIESI